MNAVCSKCHTRTPHRRTQSGSWFRFYCETCGTELTGPLDPLGLRTASSIEILRQPHPDQARIDAESAELLRNAQ